jgi:threonine dehydrogenase-like Zn-dependent dehydrogenase
VRNFRPGDRVVIPSTIARGICSYCRAGYYAQCDTANPGGPQAGTAFFGGPAETGPFNGMQAEKVRVPFANVGLVKLPPEHEVNRRATTGSPAMPPSQVLRWAVQAIDKAGTLATVGAYPQAAQSFPIGTAMNRNLTIGCQIIGDLAVRYPERIERIVLQGPTIDRCARTWLRYRRVVTGSGRPSCTRPACS